MTEYKSFLSSLTPNEREYLGLRTDKPQLNFGQLGEIIGAFYLVEQGILPKPESQEAIVSHELSRIMSRQHTYEGHKKASNYAPDFVCLESDMVDGQPCYLVTGIVEVKMGGGNYLTREKKADDWTEFWRQHPTVSGREYNSQDIRERYLKLDPTGKRATQFDGLEENLRQSLAALNAYPTAVMDKPFILASDFTIYYVTLADDPTPIPEGTTHLRLPLTRAEFSQITKEVLTPEERANGAPQEERFRKIQEQVEIAEEMLVPFCRKYSLAKTLEGVDSQALRVVAGSDFSVPDFFNQKKTDLPGPWSYLLLAAAGRLNETLVKFTTQPNEILLSEVSNPLFSSVNKLERAFLRKLATELNLNTMEHITLLAVFGGFKTLRSLMYQGREKEVDINNFYHAFEELFTQN